MAGFAANGGIIFAVVLVCFFNPSFSNKLETESECSLIKQEFLKLNIGNPNMVPDNQVNGEELEICQKDAAKTCCTPQMERKYTKASERDLYEVIRSTSSYLKGLLMQSAAQYKEAFVQMVEAAKNNTETMFTINYHKMPHKARKGALDALAIDLQKFLNRKPVNMKDTVTTFFEVLFPPVFHYIINDARSDLTENYTECLTQVRQEIHPDPFGGVPAKMFHQLEKSLQTAKVFLEALNLGVEAINTTDHLPLTGECSVALTRLRYCGHCEGHMGVKPCKGFCMNVMRGCMIELAKLDIHWSRYVDAVEKITEHMQGVFNIQDVLDLLDNRISEAIMNALEFGPKFYAEVITKCGHPSASPHSTPTPSKSIKMTPIQSSVDVHTKIESFMQNLNQSKGFYKNLADSVCNEEKFADTGNKHCWNGHKLGMYHKNVTEYTMEAQLTHNPEMPVFKGRYTAIMNLGDKLEHVIKNLAKKLPVEKMQGDQWVSNKYEDNDEGSGDRGYKYGGRGGKNHETYIDDEEFGAQSGSGSGDGNINDGINGGVRYTPDRKHNKHNRNKNIHNKDSNTDISFEEDINRRPTRKPVPTQPSQSVSIHSVFSITIATMITLATTLLM
ncbi:unnamed protein product [Owenia fusiformis]|uniref:Uncharacterized protein n=1 Tax=Owenia fusiformis TaxID=6347 RepID=A0A8S4NI13_OWEFU|nr:unnamed protein product [Owenia fusiformis]